MISGSAQASSDSRRLRARRGEHLPDDLEPDDEVLRPGSGAMVRGVGDDADHPAGDAQGDGQIRPQTDPPAVLDLRGGLGGEIGGNIGKHDDPPRPQRTKVPGERRPRAARRGLDVTAGHRAQDLEGPIIAHEFTEGAAVEPEAVDQPIEGTRDLSITRSAGRSVKRADTPAAAPKQGARPATRPPHRARAGPRRLTPPCAKRTLHLSS
jgi:hypothetical protein